MPKERKKDMPINVFSPKDNPYKTAAANLFTGQMPDFNTVIQGMPKLVAPKNPVLEQLPGRFVENQAKLQGMINDYEALAGQVSDTPLPSATPTETTGTLVAPTATQTSTTGTLTSPTYTAEDRNNYVSGLLGQLGKGDAELPTREQWESAPYGIDRLNYINKTILGNLNPDETGINYNSNYDDFVNAVKSYTPSQFTRLIEALATDGVNNNANIYNRYGLPTDEWNQVLQWIRENSPSGFTVNDIGSEYGKIYDTNKAWMDMTRRSEKDAGWENTWMPYIGTGIKTIAEALLTIAAPPVGAAMVAGDVAARSGASGDSLGTALTKGLASGALTYVGGQLVPSGPVAGPSGGGEIMGALDSVAPGTLMDMAGQVGQLMQKGYTAEQIMQGLEQGSTFQSMLQSGIESIPAQTTGLSAKDILTSPITRKLAGEVMGNLAGGGQNNSNMADIYNYYMRLLAENAQNGTTDTLESTPATLDTGTGGYTYTQMLQEPAAEEAAATSTPFLSAKQRAKLISQIRAARRAQ